MSSFPISTNKAILLKQASLTIEKDLLNTDQLNLHSQKLSQKCLRVLQIGAQMKDKET